MIKGNLKLYPKSPKSSSSTAAPHCSTDIYLQRQKKEEEEQAEGHEKYMDRSAVLRATLNSLAMMNVANVINAKKIALQNDSKKKKVDEKSLKRNENPFKSDENEHIDDVVD